MLDEFACEKGENKVNKGMKNICESERSKNEEKRQMNEKLPNRKLSKFVDLIENYVWKKWTKFMGLVLW